VRRARLFSGGVWGWWREEEEGVEKKRASVADSNSNWLGPFQSFVKRSRFEQLSPRLRRGRRHAVDKVHVVSELAERES